MFDPYYLCLLLLIFFCSSRRLHTRGAVVTGVQTCALPICIDGCVEIGSTGRYVSELSKSLRVTGPIILMNDIAPSYAPPDMMERGQISKLGRFLPLNDYAPLAEEIGTESVDLVSCLIGLHHAAPENLDGFVTSIRRVLDRKSTL